MNPFLELCDTWSVFLVERAATFVWQSTILVVIVALAALLLKRASPTVRFWLWQIMAIKLLLMPFWLVDIPLPARFASEQLPQQSAATIPIKTQIPTPTNSSTPTDPPPLAVSQPPPATTPTSWQNPPWQTWLLAVWLTVAVYQVARLFAQRQSLRRLLQQAQPAANKKAIVSECAATFGLPRPPRTLLIDANISPFVCGMRQPQLVLPQSLVDSATPTRLRQIVLHELAHIWRHDLLWCWIPSVMQIVYWFHPAAHWVAYRIKLERELACDQLAIKHSGSSASDYADTLVDVVSHTASRIAAHVALSTQFVGETK